MLFANQTSFPRLFSSSTYRPDLPSTGKKSTKIANAKKPLKYGTDDGQRGRRSGEAKDIEAELFAEENIRYVYCNQRCDVEKAQLPCVLHCAVH
jgi:hypothetical protein